MRLAAILVCVSGWCVGCGGNGVSFGGHDAGSDAQLDLGHRFDLSAGDAQPPSDLAPGIARDLGAADAQVEPDLEPPLDLGAPPDLSPQLDLGRPPDLSPAGPTGGPFSCDIGESTTACAPAIVLDCSNYTTAFALDGDDRYLLHFNEYRAAGPADPVMDGVYLVRAGTMTLLAPATKGITLALDADHVYFGGPTGLWSIRKDGSALTQLTSEYITSIPIVVDSDNVYYVAEIPPSSPTLEIHSLPKTGGNPTTLVSGDWVYGIAVDTTSLYWSSSGLRTMPKTGGAAKTLIGAGGGAMALAPDGVVFWGGGNDGGGAIFSYNPASGAIQSFPLLVPAGSAATFIPMLAVDDDVAIVSYWTQDGVHPGDESATDRLDRHSGVMTSFASSLPYTGGVLQGSAFYGIEWDSDIFRVCK